MLWLLDYKKCHAVTRRKTQKLLQNSGQDIGSSDKRAAAAAVALSSWEQTQATATLMSLLTCCRQEWGTILEEDVVRNGGGVVDVGIRCLHQNYNHPKHHHHHHQHHHSSPNDSTARYRYIDQPSRLRRYNRQKLLNRRSCCRCRR